MGQTCCQDISDHNLPVALTEQTDLYDFAPSQWPNQPRLLKLLQNSSIAVGDRKTRPYKHKNFQRYYWGNWSNEKPKGKGIYYLCDNNQQIYFQGQVDGQPNGQGHVICNFGKWQYKGKLLNGQAHGHGKITNNKQGFSFQGQWRDSRPYTGLLILKPKNKKSSKSSSNLLQKQTQTSTQIDIRPDNQQCTIRYPDGRVYTGQIDKKRFLPHGKGKVVYPDKKQYTGQWFQGQMHGHGKFLWQDGSYYQGQYMFGKKHGNGKFKYPNGKIYQGFWSQGKQNGQGILINKNGQIIKNGKWQHGQFITNQ